MEFSPLNPCVIQAIGNLGASNKATTHGENIFVPPTASQYRKELSYSPTDLEE